VATFSLHIKFEVPTLTRSNDRSWRRKIYK